jgi:hypothetical protein
LLKVFASWVLVLSLASCAVQSVKPEQRAAIKTIGVVSMLGDDVTLRSIGVTVLGNGWASVPGVMQGNDQFIADRLVSALSPRYDARAVAVARSSSATGRGADPAALRALGDNHLDAYVVVDAGAVEFGGSNQSISGLGVVRRGTFFGSRYAAFAVYRVHVFDGRTFEEIAKIDHGSTNLDGVGTEISEVDQSWWADSPDALSEAQRSKIRSKLRQLMADSVPEALHHLGLVQ